MSGQWLNLFHARKRIILDESEITLGLDQAPEPSTRRRRTIFFRIPHPFGG